MENIIGVYFLVFLLWILFAALTGALYYGAFEFYNYDDKIIILIGILFPITLPVWIVVMIVKFFKPMIKFFKEEVFGGGK